MTAAESDMVFAGSVPELYDQHLVPLIFESYAVDLVTRLEATGARRVLEVASGTGVLTRAMAASLDEAVSIIASDLNQPMLDHAASVGTARSVAWRQADVMALPFPDDSFDAVVCQFGVMFFPDRSGAFTEMGRVLRPGGTLLFNVWDRIETNEFAATVTVALAGLFPEAPPEFLPRTPHGYYRPDDVQADIVAAGFDSSFGYELLQARSRAATCDIPAIAYCQGTPLRHEIDAIDPARLGEATTAAADAIAEQFGRTDVDGLISAFVATALKP